MKSVKIKELILIVAAAMIIASVALPLVFAGGLRARAAQSEEGINFIYSAEFSSGSGKCGFIFGETDDNYLSIAVDADSEQVSLTRNGETDDLLKVCDCDLSEQFKLTLVVNEGVAKLFVGDSKIAAIVCAAEGYAGGGVRIDGGSYTVANPLFIKTDTPDGDIYVGGFGNYDGFKVVNITDGNSLLKDGEYELEGGVVTISDAYLRTLEADAEYRFRAVTSLTDLDFSVTTDFTAVNASSAISKYYKDNDVTIILSSTASVKKLQIDGKDCTFTQSGSRVVITSEEIAGLATGNHTVKLYTDKGRPETSINISESVETLTEPVEKVTHVFLWVDLAIFGAAILGYAAFAIVKRVRGKK